MTTEDDDDPKLRGALDAFAADEPPADFADGVAAALARARRSPRRGLGVAMVAMGLLAALLLLLRLPRVADGAYSLGSAPPSPSGTAAPRSARLGAALSYRVGRDGAARVAQVAGDVFYRVERGGAFVVESGAGTVEV